jgi:hypothetical protein
MGSIRVAWWNLDNLFDTLDDPIARDQRRRTSSWS